MKTKKGDMIRVCFRACGGTQAQMGHPRKVVATLKNGMVRYESAMGLLFTCASWVRVARKSKPRLAKWKPPPPSADPLVHVTRREGGIVRKC